MPKASIKNIKRQEYNKLPSELEVMVFKAIQDGKTSKIKLMRALGVNSPYLVYYLRKPDNFRRWQFKYVVNLLGITEAEADRLGSENCTNVDRLRVWLEYNASNHFNKVAKVRSDANSKRYKATSKKAIESYLKYALAA